MLEALTTPYHKAATSIWTASEIFQKIQVLQEKKTYLDWFSKLLPNLARLKKNSKLLQIRTIFKHTLLLLQRQGYQQQIYRYYYF